MKLSNLHAYEDGQLSKRSTGTTFSAINPLVQSTCRSHRAMGFFSQGHEVETSCTHHDQPSLQSGGDSESRIHKKLRRSLKEVQVFSRDMHLAILLITDYMTVAHNHQVKMDL